MTRGETMVLVAIAAVACGDGGGGLPEAVVGAIEIVEYDGLDDWAGVAAHFEEPTAVDELVDDGTCRVYRRPCLGTVGACAQPPGVDVGPIELSGLREDVTLEPGYQAGYYAALPDDAFADDAAIAVRADGPLPFELAAAGVAPMRSELGGASLPPFGDDPVAFAWDPGDDGARVRLTINVADLCHAGADWLVLECEVDDTGALTVAEPILAALPAGYGGCGGLLARVRRDAVVLDGGEVSLLVGNGDFFDVFQLR